ncbi:Tat pathway signal sequence domain protein [Caulobacter sp. 17J80-11]|uniref:Tat pathway signal sequence domain protein n=1 Tax=Caulobacter sp. 17J80-11 TaxID=2763502 RepID=UPI001653DA26|nr:Tat pathway signal sequence domain protein [Caulobacter sp. 17J80-11]MBC6983070.1 Tat pathway signal sequence domain protein [Caulobacter sp. 17J80-11]
MRRFLLALSALAIASSVAVPTDVLAQQRGKKEDAKPSEKEKKKKEWEITQRPLKDRPNAGPCPYVKVLYDAARYIEFDGKEASSAVGFSGEVEGVKAKCEYRESDPIKVQMDLLFALGRGPKADGQQKTYRYWVAVTDRNRSVLAKQYFDLPVTFQPGTDRMYVNDDVTGIVIPRLDQATSGANFEILVGLDVTPEMAAFNRAGKRFRINAGQTQSAQTQGAPAQGQTQQ